MSQKYKWKASHSMKRANANLIGAELERISEKHGGTLTPESVLDAARKKTSPLHSMFEWNNAKAAHKWRLEQASLILRNIEIVIHDNRNESIRAYVVIRENDGAQSYRKIEQVMSDKDQRAQLLDRAYKDLLDWQERYRRFHEFAAVFEAIKKTKIKSKRS